MDETKIQQLLAQILAAAVRTPDGNTPAKETVTQDSFGAVYRLAQAHDLAHILSGYVYRNQIPVSAELGVALKRVEMLAVYRCEQMKYTFKEICDAFDQAGIAYIPLKGAVIRPYYPNENMRTSCDIDILIHEEDLPLAISALEERGYRCGERAYHDVSLFSPNQIHLELHFNIQENIDSLDVVLQDAWQYAEPAEGCRHVFKKEFFVFHMYAHMAYHFLAGGCGLRSLLDIWVMEHRMDAHYSCAEELLKKAEIYRFAAEISDITNRFFLAKPLDLLGQQVLCYICSGGVYGSRGNHIAVYRSRGSGVLRYVIERIFLPYRSMTITYPVLKKAPYLLPLYWVIRWFRVIFAGKSGQLATEVACANSVSSEQVARAKAICRRLGL